MSRSHLGNYRLQKGNFRFDGAVELAVETRCKNLHLVYRVRVLILFCPILRFWVVTSKSSLKKKKQESDSAQSGKGSELGHMQLLGNLLQK